MNQAKVKMQEPSQNLTTSSNILLTSSLNPFEYTNQIAFKYIWPTFPVGFLILGTIANILSIIVFTRKEMRRFSSFCYFAFLNATNLALLYVTLTRVMMDYNLNRDLRTINLPICKIHVFLTYFLSHLSSLLLCMISIDRVISVMFIHRAKDFCTPRVAFIVTSTISMFTFALSCHFLIFESGYVETDSAFNETRIVCESRKGSIYDHIVQEVWKIVDMSIYAFIPFFIMFTCSVIIIVRVAQQSKKFNIKKPSVGTQTEQRNGRTIGDQKESFVIRNPNEAKFSTRTRNLALMLIPVNVLFLMFLAPVVISMYFYKNLSEDHLTLAIVEFLSYCNMTFNFFIYFITSSKFREEFFKFINEVFVKLKSNSTNRRFNATTNTTMFTTPRTDKVINKANVECVALVNRQKK
ncbi:FMRFamide receptor-like [Brachionus plicatilis]|uniref:FMRFamide receptor-like n=1 Tax=Brachionus plicatilis TaxID=10195 RepID=A0A3M7RGJ5_BRAPC|nr:FMRFamide receptor-like [Brachionus plicatilis]